MNSLDSGVRRNDQSLPNQSFLKKVLQVFTFTIGWALLFLGFVQSAGTIAAWTRGELGAFTFWDGFWILLLPVLIGIYLRYFSVFRKDCPACSADAAEKNRRCGSGA
jgi:hypothetical protein